MWNDNINGSWSAAGFALLETSLWQEDQRSVADLTWLDKSWKDRKIFWKALHAYSDRRQGSPSKSIPWVRYDFYHDLITRQKDPAASAVVWFDNGLWHTWTYAELGKAANSLAATWEELGVQPGETLAILHPQGPQWLMALLAGLRLGLVIALLPPQGNAFVQRRLENLNPQWLAMDQLYRHQLAPVWYDRVLSNTLSTLAPTRRSYEYLSTTLIARLFDPTSPTPELACPVDVDTLYLGAMRDGILALGIKPGEACAAPGWHGLESQPSLILTLLLSGAAWVHINYEDLEKEPQRLLEQPIHILGVSRALRDLLSANPPDGLKPWRYWFRHPAESADFTLWQDFIEHLQLEAIYSGNLLWRATLGGAIIFSARCKGKAHHTVLPAAGMIWQLGMIEAPELPCVGGWGRLAVGKEENTEIVWINTPYILTHYQKTWNYLGQYPRGRAGRTYPKQEVLELLADKTPYPALVETSVHGGDADPRQVLLAFGPGVATLALQTLIENELGKEFLPDRIEHLPLLPRHNTQGGADQDWCQFHYLTGELYRRQRGEIYRCLSELKQMVLV